MANFRHRSRRVLRLLRRRPVHAAITVLCLGLGLGSTVTTFAVLDGILLEALPYDDPAALVAPFNRSPEEGAPLLPFSEGELVDLGERATAFESVAGLMGWPFVITVGDVPEQVLGAKVSASFFSLLGVPAAVGQGFRPGDDGPDVEPSVVLSHGLWQRLSAGDPGLVGQTLELDGKPHRVRGVMSPGFRYADDFALWTPLVTERDWQMPRNARAVQLVARLAPGVERGQAQASMDDLVRGFRDEHPDAYPEGWGIYLRSLHDDVVGSARPLLLALQAVALLVLALAIANVAQLFFARALERDGEMALRTALGAARGDLVRGFLAETLPLAVLGGGLALLLANAALRLLRALPSDTLPRLDGVTVGGATLALTTALVLLVGLGFGALLGARAWRFHRSAGDGNGSRRVSGRGRGRALLVASEVALALVVSHVAALLLTSLLAVAGTDPGFEAEDRLAFQLYLPRSAQSKLGQAAAFYDDLLDDLRALPGVRHAAAIFDLPLSGVEFSGEVEVEDRPPASGERGPSVGWRTVSGGYFETLGIPLLAGRTFDDRDRDSEEATAVVIVDQGLARKLWPDRDPLGRRLALGDWADGEWLTVVGVVGSVRQEGLDQPRSEQLYLPLAQNPRRLMSIVLHTEGDPMAQADAARRAVWARDPERPVTYLRTLGKSVDEAAMGFRSNAGFFAVLAALALLLVSLGIYGVTRHSLAGRRHELGIRTALGARRGDLIRLELARVARLALLGAVPGVLVAVALARALGSLLYGVGAGDPRILLAVVLVVLALAVAAALHPAWRATRGDPATALRSE